ncbi:hypothetical protein DFH09DRAFT_1354527 [Mycena vulgaris]|nr:hypothetical protein DFH09DRAFT_1354527 [Mycena vulgaris]
MPIISNLHSEYIPGFAKLTTFDLIPDESQEPTQNKSSSSKESRTKNAWRKMEFINSAGEGYGPYATTLGDIADKIPPKPSLKKSCEKCRKRPDQDGPGYPVCASCKVSRYCSRECQTSHWKEHKELCRARAKYTELERDLEAQALRTKEPFVSQEVLRKWYYDNVDIVDYTIVQTLELYKGRTHDLWRTHAVVFYLDGGEEGTSVATKDICFDEAETASFTTLGRQDYLDALGSGSRVILIFILNDESDLLLIESHDLPADEEWAKMEKDEMWRMHIRLRMLAQMHMMGEKDSAEESE